MSVLYCLLRALSITNSRHKIKQCTCLVDFESWISESQFLDPFHVIFVATDPQAWLPLDSPHPFHLQFSDKLEILWKLELSDSTKRNGLIGSYTTSLKFDLVLKQLFSLNSNCYEDTFFKKHGNIFRLHSRSTRWA